MCTIWFGKAMVGGGFEPGIVGLAGAEVEVEASSRWAACDVAVTD
jgi:hypothetical protein